MLIHKGVVLKNRLDPYPFPFIPALFKDPHGCLIGAENQGLASPENGAIEK